MTAQGSLVASRSRRFKWAIELSAPGGGSRGRSDRGGGQGDSLYPVGYLDKQVPDTSVQETDRILVEKVQRYRCHRSLWGGSDLHTPLFCPRHYVNLLLQMPLILNIWYSNCLRLVLQ
ncbi:ER membrane protein complex subunit 4 [Phyllostomus discolor]|uniref:ER membrane protein complex subunit 4 n=1 Tax=Phyllostomus discolor TaxID=89673 RepID=A0A834BIP2_9CHIR|nr:ER membrane protein complex subunit 4 [Phyllostomus discolor]